MNYLPAIGVFALLCYLISAWSASLNKTTPWREFKAMLRGGK